MREIRRKDKKIGTDEAINLLTKCEYGFLSTIGNDGQPYGNQSQGIILRCGGY